MAGTWPANGGKAAVDRYYDRTYAQRFNQWVYDFIDPHFHYLNQEISYESLIDYLPFPNRDSVSDPDLWLFARILFDYRALGAHALAREAHQRGCFGADGFSHLFGHKYHLGIL